MKLRRVLFAGAALSLAIGASANAQNLFGTLLNEAKREVEKRARDAITRPTTPAPTPVPSSAPSTGYVPATADRPASERSPQYSGLPAFSSFWPAPEPYVPPSQRSQARTPVAAGTPDSKCCGPMTQDGKPAWVWSEYQLKTLSWGNELPTRGSAGAPEYVGLNINNSPVRQKWISTFDSWIKATYQPMGSITAPFREIYPEKAKNSHVPIRYGVTETLYSPVVKGGKVFRSPSPPFGWIEIFANGFAGDDPAWSMSVPGQNYATVMPYDRDGRFMEPKDAPQIEGEANAVRARIGIDALVYLTSRAVVVMLTRDNRLPVRQMTIGEALTIADAGIRRMQISDPSDAVTYAKRLQTVERLRAKYGANSTQPAFIRRSQFSYQDFYTDDDLFGVGQFGNRYPLYTFDPPAYAAAKGDTPAWVMITFPRLSKGYDWPTKMAHDAMADHFNFAYVRDAIFNPEKVAGVPYRPRP